MAQLDTAPPARPVPARRRSWSTPQHGAWAMLALPFLAALHHGTAWAQVPLAVAWVAGYLASYFAGLALKSRRWSRYLPQLLVYAALAVAGGGLVVALAPRVLLAAPLFAAGAAALALASRRRRDRSLAAGLVAVAQASAMALVVPVAAGRPAGTGWGEALTCALYLTGSLLFVKTMIRERNSPAYRRASAAYHLAALVGAAALDPLLAVPFAALLGRAAALPGRRVPVVAVGMMELAASVVLLGFLLLAAA
ncbi:MAG: YwiC-like family protein [Kineosporiaceae bacterium]